MRISLNGGRTKDKKFLENFLKPLDKQSNIWYNIGSPKKGLPILFMRRDYEELFSCN